MFDIWVTCHWAKVLISTRRSFEQIDTVAHSVILGAVEGTFEKVRHDGKLVSFALHEEELETVRERLSAGAELVEEAPDAMHTAAEAEAATRRDAAAAAKAAAAEREARFRQQQQQRERVREEQVRQQELKAARRKQRVVED